MSVYDQLSFIDQLNDSMRMEEFKWIVGQMNKFLGKARSALQRCEDWEAMVAWLNDHMASEAATDRKSLAYQKLRQAWTIGARNSLATAMEYREEDGEDDGGRGEER